VTRPDLPSAPPDGAVALATAVSIAVRIEPELLRAMRLTVLPYLDVGAEADLWFSQWVAKRGADGIVLLPSVRGHLQRRLAAWLAEQPTRVGDGVWETVARVHDRISPALLVEERVAWLVARYGADAAAEVDQELRPALRAIVTEGRAGVAGWFRGAWERLPDEARSTPTAWQLLQVSTRRERGGGRLSVSPVPAGLASRHLAEIAGAVGSTRMGVRRVGQDLELGETGPADAIAITVPDTDPRVVEVSSSSGADEDVSPADYQTVIVGAGEATRLWVGAGAVQIRAADGAIYRVSPPGQDELRFQHDAPVSRVAFSPDGQLLATGCDDGSARIFSVVQGELGRFAGGGVVTSLAFSPDGTQVVTGSGDGSVTALGAPYASALWTRAGSPVNAAVFDPSGSVVAIGSDDGSVRILDSRTGETRWQASHGGPVTAVAFSPDGSTIATLSRDGHRGSESSVDAGAVSDSLISILDVSVGSEVARYARAGITALAFSPDGTQMAIGSSGGMAMIPATDLTTAREFLPGVPVTALAFEPSGRRIAVAAADGSARVFDLAAAVTLSELAHDGPVLAVAFSPDGEWVITGSEDRSARVFAAGRGAEVIRHNHGGPVAAVTVSPDRSRVATASHDGTARLFGLPGSPFGIALPGTVPRVAAAGAPGDFEAVRSESRQAPGTAVVTPPRQTAQGARIVGVHGFGSQHSGSRILHAEWLAALRDGLRLAGGVPLAEEDVVVAFFGDVLRLPDEDEARQDVEPETDDLEAAAVVAMSRASEDQAAPGPDGPSGDESVPLMQRATSRLMNSKFFAGMTERSLFGDLAELRRFLHEPDLRQAARERVAQAIGPDTRVVIAHSLGSVVAYEALCAHPELNVRMFITLGSPLGVRNLRTQRLGIIGGQSQRHSMPQRYSRARLLGEPAPLRRPPYACWPASTKSNRYTTINSIVVDMSCERNYSM
jgi:WD40 repeat protein